MTEEALVRAQALGALRFCQASWQGAVGAAEMIGRDIAGAAVTLERDRLRVVVDRDGDTHEFELPLARIAANGTETLPIAA